MAAPLNVATFVRSVREIQLQNKTSLDGRSVLHPFIIEKINKAAQECFGDNCDRGISVTDAQLLLKRFEELRHRNGIRPVDEKYLPIIMRHLASELVENVETIPKIAPKEFIAFTVYYGATATDLITEFGSAFAKTQSAFKKAVVNHASRPAEFLRQAVKTIAELETESRKTGSEFAPLTTQPSIFTYAALNHPGNTRDALRRFMQRKLAMGGYTAPSRPIDTPSSNNGKPAP